MNFRAENTQVISVEFKTVMESKETVDFLGYSSIFTSLIARATKAKITDGIQIMP